ncbi:E3 ubiquitin-protein ligase MIB2 isoform X2 [Latimeria chalumnae]|uniref:E3 ubiquitin-protein ligase MIB2 isoform X2 n=1 Tax=Latimeria chalumnae TaxID=7897 RepID=UPI0003C12A82|nr:PREDICTED: E3 ubiquitin-protein ligase MIB2 isoform X2 [Latimeria chalumnae]|eukprot:XP_005986112.1 PREDICTED: E3 ubiquitin-protein ligase MIB2 isoform X2 [Latimeria chalumnae]
MEVGMRVVRGVDWIWSNQDNGEGNVGTVVEIGRQGGTTTPDKTVVVQWDYGTRTNYRTGYQGAYDLLLYDNAQIGVRHPNIICDCCKKHGIRGMRWKCKVCFDYDLCTQCFMTSKHDLAHAFERYETAHSEPVSVSPRQNLPRIALKGIFQGAKVVRGPDWEWANQDGGEGKAGKVVDIRGWDVETGRSVASVTWADGTTNVYRMGHKGKVDLKCIIEATGGFYFKDHLPILGKPAEIQRQESTDRHPFQLGDKVKCLLDIDILREMQEGHGGWNPKMAEMDTFWVGDVVRVIEDMETVKRLQVGHGEWTDSMGPALGQTGKVQKIYGDGDLRVNVGGQNWTFNPACLIAHPVEVDANLMKAENNNEARSTLISVLEKLLSQTTDPENPGQLVIEATHGNAAKVRDLVQKYPDKVDIKNQGKTALQVSAYLGHVEVVKVLLQGNANIEIRDEDGDSALHYAAFGSQAEVTHLLLSRGANPNLTNDLEHTALYIAANKGFTDVVRTLCEHNCDVNLKDSHGDTALHFAITKDFRDIIEVVTEVPNIDFTQQNNLGFNLLHHAALKGNKLATEKILARARQLVDAKKEDGFSALHLAALNNHKEVAEILIKEGRCDISIRNSRSQVALHLAVTQGHTEMIQLLVAEGSSINAEDEDGDTAMHIALGRLVSMMAAKEGDGSSLYTKLHASGLLGNVELNVGAAVACYLAQEGADINYTNHKGKTPLDLLTDGRIVQVIRNFAEKFRGRQTQLDGSSGSCSLRRVHTTPNTMTNLAMPTLLGPVECLVCSELALLVQFSPCQHSIVCEECSRRMKKCIKCQVTITKKVRQDNTEVECSPSSEPTDQRRLMEELQNRYRQMEDRIMCPICLDNHIKLVFQCGHGSCIECSVALKVCPICRQAIRERIQIFV